MLIFTSFFIIFASKSGNNLQKCEKADLNAFRIIQHPNPREKVVFYLSGRVSPPMQILQKDNATLEATEKHLGGTFL